MKLDKSKLINIFPTKNYILLELDEEKIVEKNDIVLPNIIHYETDGGKVGARVDPKKYENTGVLLRSTNTELEDLIYKSLENNKIENKDLVNIKVTLRDKAVIEYFKLDNVVYENIVIANINDIRYISIETNN